MEQVKLTKKYSLLTAIAMVIGIVIGSGVFFKSEEVLAITKGNALIGTLAWIIGGIIMIICSYTFAILASKYQKINGLVDYAEVLVNKKYANIISFLSATIWFPVMSAILAFLSAKYLGLIFSHAFSMYMLIVISIVFIIISFVLNILLPKLSGKYQILSTYIKLIPMVIVALVGIIYGLINQNGAPANLKVNFNYPSSGGLKMFVDALIKTAFAYEGWIIATSINAEIKNPKKNLPRALLIGSVIIMAIYLSYYLGILGSAQMSFLLTPNQGVTAGYINLFGRSITPILNGFIFISCTGTLNGLMIANVRTFYTNSVREIGIAPRFFGHINPFFKMPIRSAFLSLGVTLGWFGLFILQINALLPSWLFDLSELPIIFMYCFYPLIFIMMIIKNKKDNVLRRFIMPILAIIAALFMVYALIFNNLNGIDSFVLLCYLLVEVLHYCELSNRTQLLAPNLFMKGIR